MEQRTLWKLLLKEMSELVYEEETEWKSVNPLHEIQRRLDELCPEHLLSIALKQNNSGKKIGKQRNMNSFNSLSYHFIIKK
jgi:hypothetical protein